MVGDAQGVVRRRSTALLSPLRIPHFRRLWLADMISLLGDWAGRLALTVLVLDRTGSPAWAAAVTAVSLAGFVGIGQVLATLADRHGRIAVMLVADVARAALFFAMLISMPVGGLLVLAFLAGLATPPFEAARAAATPDLVPEETYGDALALAGISVQASLVVGYALGGVLLTLVSPETAIAINAVTFLISALLLLGLRNTPAAQPAEGHTSMKRSLGEGAAVLFGDRMVRRALVIVSVTGALGTVDEALVVPYGDGIGLGDGVFGLLAAAVPIGTLVATAAISSGTHDHHALLRNAGWCGMVTSALAAPLFWFEASGAFAFLAFMVAGGMFAVSIPTNAVIGLRLRRDTRASAMGIAVGILMGSQALGAALGGLAASAVGPAQAIGGALAAAAVFCAWSVVTTPTDAKHLARRRPPQSEPGVVLDLVAMKATSAPAAVP
ncbi:MAG: MFS transporter [Acidimicrobiales bacterium]